MRLSSRRIFIKDVALTTTLIPFFPEILLSNNNSSYHPKRIISDICQQLEPIGRILETEGYYVWCNSPIYGPDGKVHIFFSRWPEKYGMGGWIHQSEIAHAVVDTPVSEFKYVKTVLSSRKGYFDETTCHNPHIKCYNGKYYLFYMGNSNKKTNTKRIGLAVADSIYGPWKRKDKPLLEAGEEGSWDDHCTTNPSVIQHPSGQFWLYYKSWNTKEYINARKGSIRGNRKYGLAIAEDIEGPYIKYSGNPVIDLSKKGNNVQLEDAFVWYEKRKFKLIARDMGLFDHKTGLYFESKNGKSWNKPEIAYYEMAHYIEQPPAPSHLKRYGRLERPQLLLNNGKPEYLFTTSQGGKYNTSSGFVLKINPKK